MRRRGQSWSIDVVLAIVIFGFIAISFTSFSLLNQPDVEVLQQNSQQIIVELEKPVGVCGTPLVNDTLNYTALECIFQTPYEQFKSQNKIKGEFCLYLEGSDGRVYSFRDGSGDERLGWGSNELILSDVPCGETI